MLRRRGASKKGKDTEEEQEARPRMETPRGTTITWSPAQTVALDQTTTSKMEVGTEGAVKVEKVSGGKTAEIKMERGRDLGTDTDSEMKAHIEGGALINKEDIKTHSLPSPGLKPPSQDLNRIKVPCTNPTPGSKAGAQRSRETVAGIHSVQR